MESQNHFTNITEDKCCNSDVSENKVIRVYKQNWMNNIEHTEQANVKETPLSNAKRSDRVWSHLNELKKTGIMGGLRGRIQERHIRKGKIQSGSQPNGSIKKRNENICNWFSENDIQSISQP